MDYGRIQGSDLLFPNGEGVLVSRPGFYMEQSKDALWQRFQKYNSEFPSLGMAIDLSRMHFEDGFLQRMSSPMDKALATMAKLEKGDIANPDEQRMVGHYWLRNPSLAPTADIRQAIEEAIESIKVFARQVHTKDIQGSGGPFLNLLVIGIGGSALGPQFVSTALGNPATDPMHLYFFDNTDPDGMDKTLAAIGGRLGQTLCLVISKSGGTKETRNGMLEAQEAYRRANLDFGQHAIVITQEGSELDNYAIKQNWLQRFPLWDWVGGRTSETAPVGLLPAALQGLEIDGILRGAQACDEQTREKDVMKNPAAQLALMWFHAGQGKGLKDMVVLPYKDRLELFSKYLQQLVMESIGKERDLDGKIVHQGLAVYGNKGSTDQHSYIQQLRDGFNNFFATFIEVLKDREGDAFEVEPDITSGDYLQGFFLGTRRALYENGRESITITINEVSPFSVGVLIALFERAVGLYASLVNVNAYHQPGVEAGKKAAGEILGLQKQILAFLRQNRGSALSLSQIAGATKMDGQSDMETLYKICEHLVVNGRGICKEDGASRFEGTYRLI